VTSCMRFEPTTGETCTRTRGDAALPVTGFAVFWRDIVDGAFRGSAHGGYFLGFFLDCLATASAACSASHAARSIS
jgi:hypothetical protein